MYFPLWGTCLGFEVILAVQANLTEDIRFTCSAHMPNNLTIEDVRPKMINLKRFMFCYDFSCCVDFIASDWYLTMQ